MKKLLSELFPYPSYLSLPGTWLIATALYVLAGGAFLASQSLQGYFSFLLFWVLGPFVPIDMYVAFFAYGGFLMLLFQRISAPGLAYVFCGIPLLTLITILAADWGMQKIRIPPAPVKLLLNLALLFILNVIVHMILWQTWNPWIIFTPPTIRL
ncbi:MAG: hypothetical protein ACREDT_14350 [Methylocella sp.]